MAGSNNFLRRACCPHLVGRGMARADWYGLDHLLRTGRPAFARGAPCHQGLPLDDLFTGDDRLRIGCFKLARREACGGHHRRGGGKPTPSSSALKPACAATWS